VRISRTFLFAAAFIYSFTLDAKIAEHPITIDLGSRISLESNILGERRNLFIALPESYSNTDKHYPVLYVLDGDSHFNHAVIASQYLRSLDRIPELIIVAIPNNEGTRYRDLHLENENFTHFITDELMAYVDKRYRTTRQNTLFGSSSAGAFALQLLSNEPELFQNYIASSPYVSINNSTRYIEFLKTLEQQAQVKSLYFSLTEEKEEGKTRTDAVSQFVERLNTNPPKNLHWRYEFLTNQAHLSTPYLSMFNGLTHVFASYQAPSLSSYKEYLDFGGVHGIDKYYKIRAQIYATAPSTPQKTFLNIASMLLSEDQAEASLQIYRELTERFPESAQAFSGLGKAFDAMQQYDKAIIAHKKAIKLAENMDIDWQALFQNRLDKVMEKVSSLAQKIKA
jgi:uncharacterized protein